MSGKTPVERVAEVMADRCGGDWDPTHEDDARNMLTVAVEDLEGLAEALQQADWRVALHGVTFADLPERDRAWWLDLAHAVARWLTGDS